MLSLALALGMTVTGFSGNNVKAADYGLSNPRVDSMGNVTWDCAYFGSYYQTAQWTKEPIKWRVLSVDEDNNALIVADKVLDTKRYNETDNEGYGVTWEASTLRSWLNGYDADSNDDGIDYSMDNFIDVAFTEEEQAAINTSTVINNDNSRYGTEGGNDTEDKVYLLSLEDVKNTEYGFRGNGSTLGARNTDFNNYNGGYWDYGMYCDCLWWLRSIGSDSKNAMNISLVGNYDEGGSNITDDFMGVRPVLSINLSSTTVWTDAGVTDSSGNNGTSDDKIDNPVINNGVTTWDCIYFGSYNQTATFIKEPIKWRVLSVNEDDALFVADKILDWKLYNENNGAISWETSTLRSWLNGYNADNNLSAINYSSDNFVDTAFTEEEQSAIKNIEERSNDKICLLSTEEIANVDYGFNSYNDIKEAKNSDYTRVKGAGTSSWDPADVGNGDWWLYSLDVSSSKAYVNSAGGSSTGSTTLCLGVRPALRINLSSLVWEAAGTVKSDGTVDESDIRPVISPEPTKDPSDGNGQEPTTIPDTTSTEQPVTKPTSQPTQAPVVTQSPVQTIAPTDTPKADDKVSKTDEVKTFKLSSLKIKKNTTKITGKVSVSKAIVKIKVGSKAWKKATVKGKKFTFKTAKLKKNTKVQIKVSKKGYKTLKKSFKVK